MTTRILPFITPYLEARFRNKVTETDGCWLYGGYISDEGYGVLRIGGKHGPMVKAHRLAYALNRHADPGEWDVCHTCDVRACVRPDHLWLGTRADNTADMDHKGRRRTSRRVGVLNTRAKLNETTVRTIRAAAAQGVSNATLARQYNMGKTSIWLLVNRRTWNQLP